MKLVNIVPPAVSGSVHVQQLLLLLGEAHMELLGEARAAFMEVVIFLSEKEMMWSISSTGLEHVGTG